MQKEARQGGKNRLNIGKNNSQKWAFIMHPSRNTHFREVEWKLKKTRSKRTRHALRKLCFCPSWRLMRSIMISSCSSLQAPCCVSGAVLSINKSIWSHVKRSVYHDKVLSRTNRGISPERESFCLQRFLKFINLSKGFKVHLEFFTAIIHCWVSDSGCTHTANGFDLGLNVSNELCIILA